MGRHIFSANKNTRKTDTMGFVMIWTGFAGFLVSIFRYPTVHVAFLALVPLGVLVVFTGKVIQGLANVVRPSHDKTEFMKRRAGMKTELEIAAELDKLKRRGYRVVHNLDVVLPGNKAQIDHIVIGPNGVFHVETKGWSGNIRFNKGQVLRDEGKHTENPTGQVRHHEIVMKRLLRTNGFKTVPLHGILCFGSENARLSGKSERYATVKRDRLNQLILQWRPQRVLSPRESKQISKLIHSRSRESKFVISADSHTGGAAEKQGIPFVRMALRPENWLYSIFGIVISLCIVLVLKLLG